MIPTLAHALIAVAVSLTMALPSAPVTPSGDQVWPLKPQPDVVRAFDPPATTYGSGHRGVDLMGHLGQTVSAAEAGTVTFAGKLAGRGVVVVNHGATRTTYEPVSAAVHIGEQVAAGVEIGTLQLFGSHCYPRSCLHWGLIDGETYLDPLSLVGAKRVRLLPLFAGPSWSPSASWPALPGASHSPTWSSRSRSPAPLTGSASPPWWLLP